MECSIELMIMEELKQRLLTRLNCYFDLKRCYDCHSQIGTWKKKEKIKSVLHQANNKKTEERKIHLNSVSLNASSLNYRKLCCKR